MMLNSVISKHAVSLLHDKDAFMGCSVTDVLMKLLKFNSLSFTMAGARTGECAHV